VTVFGTTGEGASVSLAEREQVLEALSDAGLEMRHQVLGGVIAASVGDAVEQARMAIQGSCRGLLVAPPFYYKEVTDEGLYGWFSGVIEKIDPQECEIILYHIPSSTGVALSTRLIARLQEAFPGIVKGVKDSGSDWSYTEELLKMHSDLLVLIANERHLSAGIRLGAQGAISGLANIYPEILLNVVTTGVEDARVAALADQILRFPFVPAVKSLLADRENDAAWRPVRPPLVMLSEAEGAGLASACDRILA
jgi:4-hydroxy-tetrahydrodipicolinate synthase